jgi:hypothetical protein
MAVESVGSSPGATASATRLAADAQQVERREPRPEEKKEVSVEAPKPVKNVEGQTTGSVVNVTA